MNSLEISKKISRIIKKFSKGSLNSLGFSEKFSRIVSLAWQWVILCHKFSYI